MHRLVRAIAPALLLLSATAGSAATLIGGDTRVAFSDAIAGLTPGVTGTATVVAAAPLTVNFGITGGTLDAALAGQILHNGSGVTLSNGTNTVGLGNFIIDTVASTLFGDASLNGVTLGTALPLATFDLSSVTVAELTNLDSPLLSLLLTSTAAGALTTAFGVADLTGASIGSAATSPLSAIPEPATWLMLIVGFGAVGLALRQRPVPATAR